MQDRPFALVDGSCAEREGAYVHLETPEVRVTSDVLPAAVAELSAVCPRKLGGALGRYVYPCDAVVVFRRAGAATLGAGLQACAQSWLDQCRLAESVPTAALAHRTVHRPVQPEDEPEEEEDEDEEEEDEEEEDEGDEGDDAVEWESEVEEDQIEDGAVEG